MCETRPNGAPHHCSISLPVQRRVPPALAHCRNRLDRSLNDQNYASDIMPLSKVITAVAIHLLVPLLGVVAFLLLCLRMSRAKISSPPYFSWFVLFGTFGGWLLVVLTALFWEWPGMASIGVFGSVLVAPFVTAALALSLRTRRALSRFHRGAFAASVGYSGLMFVTALGWLGVSTFAK